MNVTGRLEGWYWDSYHGIIWGYLYDDIRERWWDGARIHTSLITSHKLGEAKEGDIVTTLNSTYLLGKPFEKE